MGQLNCSDYSRPVKRLAGAGLTIAAALNGQEGQVLFFLNWGHVEYISLIVRHTRRQHG
jgi:hypothetical protein